MDGPQWSRFPPLLHYAPIRCRLHRRRSV